MLFVNIPYQDPTPSTQSRWDLDTAIAKAMMASGLIVMSVGAAASAISMLARRRRKP